MHILIQLLLLQDWQLLQIEVYLCGGNPEEIDAELFYLSCELKKQLKDHSLSLVHYIHYRQKNLLTDLSDTWTRYTKGEP